VPLLALTATATPRVQRDVVAQLALQHCVIFRSSFNRANLRRASCSNPLPPVPATIGSLHAAKLPLIVAPNSMQLMFTWPTVPPRQWAKVGCQQDCLPQGSALAPCSKLTRCRVPRYVPS
jgi:hypothetical protein